MKASCDAKSSLDDLLERLNGAAIAGMPLDEKKLALENSQKLPEP